MAYPDFLNRPTQSQVMVSKLDPPLIPDFRDAEFPLSAARKDALVFLLEEGFWIDHRGWLWRLDEHDYCIRVTRLNWNVISQLHRDGIIVWSPMGNVAVHAARVR
jgi:hypothetical protein